MGTSHLSGPLLVGGIPVWGSGIPATFGQVFFVDYDYGSDGYDGTTADQPFKTVAAGYDALRTNRHDVLVLSGVSAHPLTTQLAVAKSRVHIMGLGGGSRYLGQRARLEMGVTTGTGIAAVLNTGVGNTFTNLKIRSVDSLASSVFGFADGGEYTQMSYCSVEKDEDLNQTAAAELLCNADSGYYYRCTFGNQIYQVSVARQVLLLNRETIAGKVCRDTIFEDCLFLNKTSSVSARHVYGSGATDVERMLLFRRCIFWTAKLSAATQAVSFSFGAAQTEGSVLLDDCTVMGASDLCVDGGVAVGIFHNSSAKADTAVEALQGGAT